MKIKQSKLFWVILGIAIIVALVKIYNPIQRVVLEKYFEKKYDQSEYEIGYKYFFDVENYNDLSESLAWDCGFRYPANVFRISSKKSIDVEFYIGIHNFKIMSSYDFDVEERTNTLLRLESKCNEIVEGFVRKLKDVIIDEKEEEPYFLQPCYGVSLVPYSDNQDLSEILQLDMPFEDSIPLKKVFLAQTTIKKEGLNEIITAVKQWNEVFKSNGLSIDEYKVRCAGVYEDSVGYTIATGELDSDTLIENLTEQYNQYIQEHPEEGP